ncbi:hypothetical protein GCM10020295_32680 [Streptomyces cinereospinus]
MTTRTAGPSRAARAGGPASPTSTGGFAAFLRAFVWDTVEMPFIAEAEGGIPVPFEPDTGEWLGGDAGLRLEAYGRFASA